MSDHSSSVLEGNDTATWGKDQSWAVVWFLSVVILAPIFVYALSRIDSWMYHSNGEVNIAGVKLPDNEKYVANRKASFGISSERSDSRARGSLTSAYHNLEKSR